MTKSRLLLFSLLCFCVGYAEEPEATPAPTVELHFSVFPLDGSSFKGLHYAPDGNPENEAVELTFNTLERSIAYPYKGPTPLVFFSKQETEGEDPVWNPEVRMALDPENTPGQLLLFFSKDKDTGKTDIHVMEDTEDTFPDESLVFYNTLDIPLVGVLNDEKIQAPPGISKPMRVKPFFDREVPIILAIHDREDFHLVMRNQIRFAPERRTLIILRPPRRKGSLRIRTQRLTEFTGKRSNAE